MVNTYEFFNFFFYRFVSLKRYLIVINNKAIEIIKLIVASENPKILKLTFLQLGNTLLKLSNNLDLSIISSFSFVHPENSANTPFSIPKWYPETIRLPEKIVISRYNHILLLGKKNPKKLIIIVKMYGIL